MKGDAGAHSAIEVLACRNNLNRKGIVSLQLTADSSQLVAFIFLPSPLITVTDPSHSFRMTFYRPSSLRTGVRMLYENEEKSQHDTERRIYYTDDALPYLVILNGGKNAV